MKAMLIRRYGGPEVLELGEVEAPRPRDGEVLVRVLGSSVNPVDAGIRAGALSAFVPLALPAVLGVDVAGEVVELGPGVTGFARGERVFAFTGIDRGGGYGEYAALPAGFLARVPARLSWAEAGTVPGVGATAYEAFTVHAPLEPGMRVFINGGAGGVGTYAIQIAKALGADVAATCSPGKAELVRELGADVIDYASGDPFGTGRPLHDVVLNCVRGAPLAAMRPLLTRDGVLVTITGTPEEAALGHAPPAPGEPRTVVFFVKTDGGLLEGLAALMASGKVRPSVERTYGWAELAEAHRRVETGRVAGKVAVVPGA